MTLLNNIKPSTCKTCGECCSMEIPITLMDIEQIARHKEMDVGYVFETVLQKDISAKTGLFMIQKNEDRSCLFLSVDRKCAIHPAKPNVCRFYQCTFKDQEKMMTWPSTYTSKSQQAELWKHSIAAEITRAYIHKNGVAWNETDYASAMSSIQCHIPTRKSQTLKLARTRNGFAVSMLYDCSQCEKKGTWAKETPVTLDDIRRISKYLNKSYAHFFRHYIAAEPCISSGGLKLKRDRNCIFFHPEHHCNVKDVRPLHCRFTPCPKQMADPETAAVLFLGSGTVMDQYRHQVALAETRSYVSKFGTTYRKGEINKGICNIDSHMNTESERDLFLTNIAKFRYIDDTQVERHTDNS